MSIDVLKRTFPVVENPGLDTLDPRWSEITGLVQAGQFAEAAQQSAALLDSGVCDVRVVGYLCFGHLNGEGPRALAPVLQGLGAMLDANWDALGPRDQRAKAAQQSLTWLFKHALKRMQREESTQSDEWARWKSACSVELLGEALAAVESLREILVARLGEVVAQALDPLAKLEAWLRSLHAALALEVQPPPAPDEPAPSQPAPDEPAPATSTQPRGEGANGAASFHLAQLLQKIDAFATLLEAGKLVPARIVADDISAILSHFDPLLYFPKMFSRFARLMALHSRDLAELDVNPEAPPWNALRSLYQVDLEEFLKLE
jgi:hypothetical protein